MIRVSLLKIFISQISRILDNEDDIFIFSRNFRKFKLKKQNAFIWFLWMSNFIGQEGDSANPNISIPAAITLNNLTERLFSEKTNETDGKWTLMLRTNERNLFERWKMVRPWTMNSNERNEKMSNVPISWRLNLWKC